MSKIAATVILCLTAALFFGLGYRAGYVPPPALEFQPLPAQAPREELDAVAKQVSEVLQIADPLERAKQLSALLQTLGADSITAVRQGYDTVFMDLRETELRLLAVWWTRLDPQSAFRWTQVNWAGTSMLTEVMRAWGARDPRAAEAALGLVVANPAHMRECVMALAQGWDESGQPGLGEFMSSMPAGPDQQRVIATITRRMVLRDGIEKTTAWLEALPEDQPPNRFKLQAYRRVASAIASVDPETGAAWATQHGGGKYGSGVYKRVAARWAPKDGPATMEWVKGLPEGYDRDWAVREGFQRWSSYNREAAQAWIAAEPVALWNEPARAIYAGGLARNDPQAGIAVAELFENEQLRDETLEQIARVWMNRDPEAAQPWIEASDLSENAKKRALRPRANPQRRQRVDPDPDRDE